MHPAGVILNLVFPFEPGDVVSASDANNRCGRFGIKGPSLVVRQIIDYKPRLPRFQAYRRVPLLILRLENKGVNDQPRFLRHFDRAPILEKNDHKGFFLRDYDIIQSDFKVFDYLYGSHSHSLDQRLTPDLLNPAHRLSPRIDLSNKADSSDCNDELSKTA